MRVRVKATDEVAEVKPNIINGKIISYSRIYRPEDVEEIPICRMMSQWEQDAIAFSDPVEYEQGN